MAPSGAAIGAIIGAMLCANSTQAGFSGSTEPWPGSTVRPLRTISERRLNGSWTMGLPRNRAVEATRPGERGSRNIGTRLGVAVASLRLAQEPDHREEVAQDAGAALGGRGAARERGDIPRSLANRPEQVELDGRPQRCRALVGEQRFEHERGRGRSSRFRPV